MTYEQCEDKCIFIATKFIKMYFLRIDRKRVTQEETMEMCPNFIKEMWNILNKKRKYHE